MGGKRRRIVGGDKNKQLKEEAIRNVIAIHLRIPADAEELAGVWNELKRGDTNAAIKKLLEIIKSRRSLSPEEEQLVCIALGIEPKKIEKKVTRQIVKY